MNHIKEEDGLMIGICNGFQALVKLGLLPYGEIRTLEEDAPTLTFNAINRHVARVSKTKVTSVNSPWMANVNIGDIHNIAISHGEGRFFANEEWVKTLKDKGQIITQYVDANGNPQKSGVDNPNGSTEAIEGIISPDGRILGKMGHSERYEEGLLKNIPGNKKQDLFTAGISYYK
jgi:phosphoribosylformylglycinamidine synthase